MDWPIGLVSSMMRFLVVVVAAFVLAGCTPAAYVHVYNATGDAITVLMEKSERAVTIPAGGAADFSPADRPGERVVIRTSRHSWRYLPRSFFPPASFIQQHTMVMRAFARIDKRGCI